MTPFLVSNVVVDCGPWCDRNTYHLTNTDLGVTNIIPFLVLGIVVIVLYFIFKAEKKEPAMDKKANIFYFKYPQEVETIFKVVDEYLESNKDVLAKYPLLVNPYAFMLAVRMCEQGRPGLEFGVMAAKDTDLKTQAEWTMATLIKDTQRWHTNKLANGKNRSDYASFIHYFADKWAPIGASNDPNNLNKNWLPNFLKFYGMFLP